MIEVSSTLVSTTRAAILLGVSRDTVLRLIAGGQLSAVNVGTGHRPIYRIALDCIEDFKKQRNTTMNPTRPVPRRKPGRRRKWVR